MNAGIVDLFKGTTVSLAPSYTESMVTPVMTKWNFDTGFGFIFLSAKLTYILLSVNSPSTILGWC